MPIGVLSSYLLSSSCYIILKPQAPKCLGGGNLDNFLVFNSSL